MNFHDKQKMLITKLHEKTRNNEIVWSEDVGKNTYKTSLPKSFIKIKKNVDDLQLPQFIVSIYNEEGVLVEVFDQTDIDYPIKYFDTLYENARRIALDADKVLDEVLASLDA